VSLREDASTSWASSSGRLRRLDEQAHARQDRRFFRADILTFKAGIWSHVAIGAPFIQYTKVNQSQFYSNFLQGKCAKYIVKLSKTFMHLENVGEKIWVKKFMNVKI
jgi:hypothetical protein